MQNFLIGRVLRWSAGKLDGYKTLIGGIGLVLTGLVGLLGYMFPDQGLPTQDLDTALTTIASGFAVIGLGDKLEKTKDAMVAQNVDN